MFVIIIVSFLAALSFRKELVRQNRNVPKVWLQPIFIGLAIILTAQIPSYLIATYCHDFAWCNMLLFSVSVLMILVYFSIISRKWQSIKAYKTNRGQSTD